MIANFHVSMISVTRFLVWYSGLGIVVQCKRMVSIVYSVCVLCLRCNIFSVSDEIFFQVRNFSEPKLGRAFVAH